MGGRRGGWVSTASVLLLLLLLVLGQLKLVVVLLELLLVLLLLLLILGGIGGAGLGGHGRRRLGSAERFQETFKQRCERISTTTVLRLGGGFCGRCCRCTPVLRRRLSVGRLRLRERTWRRGSPLISRVRHPLRCRRRCAGRLCPVTGRSRQRRIRIGYRSRARFENRGLGKGAVCWRREIIACRCFSISTQKPHRGISG